MKFTVTPAKAGVSGGGAIRWDMTRGGYTYIMTNRPRGTLYIGVTTNIVARAEQHRNGTGSGFCKKYGLTRLVLVEPHDDIRLAIAREKALKAWKREWKIRLVEEGNPDWRDMSDVIF
ncbi:GIY-YIG nuclease family protein [Sphingobium sp. CR2-8]|uniref:GIY-YIG nuclease family protein n=1 Tax=Sphingobium sp. CR2-8 TaxID=1306534 RepID=UPI002DBC21A3|nr:GIY-YIG nuclease family protein [Sphingobium sp. CR2-8]MEC3912062.1 GIY-YIG nuclease family protein [Sphingobium sp. CR2-8]